MRELLERWDRIGNEAQGLTNSPAGMYIKSGYRGWMLRWAPGAGYVYVYHSEGLDIIDFSYGKVEVTTSEIRFIPERDMRRTFRGKKLQIPLSWVPAQLSESRFMVPKNEIGNFGQYLAGLVDYNDFNGPCCEFDPFFVLQGSRGAQAPTGSAVLVPAEYQRFIRQPITGQIISIGKRRIVKGYAVHATLFSHYFEESALTPITIDAGRVHGLRKNMLLRFAGDQSNQPRQFVRVTSVGSRTAVAVLIRPIYENDRESYLAGFPAIRAGMRVTTSPILNN